MGIIRASVPEGVLSVAQGDVQADINADGTIDLPNDLHYVLEHGVGITATPQQPKPLPSPLPAKSEDKKPVVVAKKA